MKTEISKTRFKAQALKIFRRLEKTGEPLIVTDRGRPSLIVRKYTRQAPQPVMISAITAWEIAMLVDKDRLIAAALLHQLRTQPVGP